MKPYLSDFQADLIIHLNTPNCIYKKKIRGSRKSRDSFSDSVLGIRWQTGACTHFSSLNCLEFKRFYRFWRIAGFWFTWDHTLGNESHIWKSINCTLAVFGQLQFSEFCISWCFRFKTGVKTTPSKENRCPWSAAEGYADFRTVMKFLLYFHTLSSVGPVPLFLWKYTFIAKRISNRYVILCSKVK